MKTKNNKKINAAQRKHIFGLAKQIGYDIDDIRGVAREVSGLASISSLTYLQAEEVKRRLGQKVGAARPTRRPQGKNVIYLASDGEKWKITYLARDAGWIDHNELYQYGMVVALKSPRLRGFIEKQTKGKKKSLHQLTSSEAGNIIEALKGIVSGGRGERSSGNSKRET